LLSNTTATFTATIGGIQAAVSFAGLAPTLSGIYQLNITVPGNAPTGNLPLTIFGPDSVTSMATISVGPAVGVMQ
jgi:uncharacterized protein (TIGR03437 family)